MHLFPLENADLGKRECWLKKCMLIGRATAKCEHPDCMRVMASPRNLVAPPSVMSRRTYL